MAKKKTESKIELKRTYNVPLRKEFMKAPRWKRTNRAVKALKKFLFRHMKATEVKLGKYLNEHLWKRGIKNPPHHVKVEAEKDSEGVVRAELVGAKIVVDKRFKKKKEIKKLKEKKEEVGKKEIKEERKIEEKEKEGEEKSEEKKVEEKSEEKTEEIKKEKGTGKKETKKKERVEKKKFNAKGPKEAEVPKAEELVKK